MILTHTVRLYPTPSQEQTLSSWLRCAAKVWNHFLEHRIKVYKRRQERVGFARQCSMLTVWRSYDEWMRSVPQRVQRDAIRRLDEAFSAFFRRSKTGGSAGFPRFKSSRRWSSVAFSRFGREVIQAGRVNVPKLGLIRCRGLRPIEGQIKQLRIIRRASGWYAQLVIDDGLSPPEKKPVESAVGIDVGLESFATLSTGEQVPNPRHGRRLAPKLARSQRRLKRRQKGSKRRAKQVRRVARIHERIAAARQDHAHKTSRNLVDQFDLIAAEKLNIRNMGRQSKLARSIYDAGWGNFLQCLSFKAASAGRTYLEVNPAGTSQECSGCGQRVQKPLSQRWHECPCGTSLHRDVNAARNILARAVGAGVTRVEPSLSGR